MTVLELRMKRINEGLSPEALGRKINVAGQTIRRIESGEVPTPIVAHKVAQYVGKEAADLWPDLIEGEAA